MKKFFLIISFFVLIFNYYQSVIIAQTEISTEVQESKIEKKLASINIKDLTGKIVNTADFDNGDKPMVINFWATWCKPCIEELNTINELYTDWQDETGVKIIAISIDDSRNSKRVAPFIKAKDWGYEVYLDENSDFKRAMGVNNPPHTYVLDGNKNIIYEHNGYAPGDEVNLFNEIKKAILPQGQENK